MTPNQYVAMELQTALEALIPAVKTVALFSALGLLLVLLALLLAMAAVWLSGELRGERHGRREIRRAAATAGTSFTVPRTARRAAGRDGSRARPAFSRATWLLARPFARAGVRGWVRPALRRPIH